MWKIDKRVLWLLIILIFFPLLPLFYYGVVYKFLAIILFFFFLVVFFLDIRESINVLKNDLFLFSNFIFIVFYGVVLGFFKRAVSITMVKDILFFSTPAIVYFLLLKTKPEIDNFLNNLVIDYGKIASLLQIGVAIIGLYLWFNGYMKRPHFRHWFVLLSTPVIYFSMFFHLLNKNFFLTPLFLFFSTGLIITAGRAEMLFVLSVLTGVFLIRVFRSYKLRGSFLLFLAVIFLIGYFVPLFFYNKINDSSMSWRYKEWISYKIFSEQKELSQVVTGNGFGSKMPLIKPLKLFGKKLIVSKADRFHNFVLFLIFKTGLIGIIFLFSMFFFFFKNFNLFSSDKYFLVSLYFVLLFFLLGLVRGGFTMNFFNSVHIGFLFYLRKLIVEKEV